MAQHTTFSSVLAEAFKRFKRELLIGLPAKVTNVDKFATRQCVNVKPQLETLFFDGEHEQYPEILNVPVRMPAVSGGALTLPISVGDIVWLSFSSGSIDEFLETEGEIVIPLDGRRGTINDCVVELGFPTFINNTTPDPDNLQLYYNDSVITLFKEGGMSIVTEGDLNVQVAGNLTATVRGSVDINSEQTVNLTAPNIVLNGNTNINGDLTTSGSTSTMGSATIAGDATIAGITYSGHTHLVGTTPTSAPQ